MPASKKITDLKDLEIDEVSLCAVGANPKAFVKIAKVREPLSLRSHPADPGAVRTHDHQEAERELIYKCLEACDSGDLRPVSKRDFENALDILAKRLSDQVGHVYAAAYSEVLQSDLGCELYAGMEACQRQGRY